jgi:PadR family transcriptional regulator PadR
MRSQNNQSCIEARHRTTIQVMDRIPDDRELYGGLIRLHVLHHANGEPIYGHWMIAELRRHGYDIGPGTMYPLLHGLERKGYLRAKRERTGSRYRKVYRITSSGRRALGVARRRVQELFGEMFEKAQRKKRTAT